MIDKASWTKLCGTFLSVYLPSLPVLLLLPSQLQKLTGNLSYLSKGTSKRSANFSSERLLRIEHFELENLTIILSSMK